MIDLEQRLREAYDAQHLPDAVRARTLAAIDEARHADAHAWGKARQARAARRRPRRQFVALAACLLLVLAAFGAYSVYRIPSAYVDIDVNPSIELTVNPLGIVIAAEPLNDDGRVVLDEVALVNRPYASAIGALMGSALFGPYIQEEAFVDINVVSDSDRLGDELVAQSDAALAATACGHRCQRADAALRSEAVAAGMGVGRYRAACELIELDPSYTLEDCSTMTMRQLRDHIDACHNNEDSDTNDEESAGQSNGRGHGKGHGNGHRHRQG
ncbi:hypothetical protein VIN30_03200 [Adlercreutzia sp. R7]|uniref:Anti-sigma factor RsgI-like middle domain-containing protein n=1 Tax=Adlercreutzia wanghongyangiae TaxID=3111451 RepID=A0ABU6IG78_9ACTN|nr:hypothetical protein [Adlercreutzia sp. R7]